MPLSPSMQSAPQPSPFPTEKQDAHEYRQTTYRNGRNVQIEESRRHRWTGWKVEQSVQPYTDFVLYPKGNEDTYPQSGFEQVSSQAHPAPRRRVAEPSSESHVTFAKRSSKARPGPVVLHAEAKSSQIMPLKTKAAAKSSTGSTPPPTPRLSRLSTPEFDNLDDAPFCGCDMEANVGKRCTMCSRDVNLW